jgi:hypothetical protein
MSLNNTFRGKFGLVDPSTLHNVLSMRSGNQVPGLILQQGINFSLHCMFPFGSSFDIK